VAELNFSERFANCSQPEAENLPDKAFKELPEVSAHQSKPPFVKPTKLTKNLLQ